MKNVTLRQLRVFEAVARHLNYSRAAEELRMSQPGVSTHVKQLEAHAGLPLFEQVGKQIGQSFVFGDLHIDMASLKAQRGSRGIDLTKREALLVQYFAANPNRVIDREELYREVWHDILTDLGNLRPRYPLPAWRIFPLTRTKSSPRQWTREPA